MGRTRRIANRLLVGLFLLGIALPGLSLMTGWEPITPSEEKRALAERPGWPRDRHALASFPEAFDDYYNDHFGFRSLLIRSYHLFFSRWLQGTDSLVVVGRDGWLFYRPSTVTSRTVPFSESDLRAWKELLEKRRDWLRERGVRFVYAMAPTKDNVYPEYLPGRLQHDRGPTRMDQLFDYMAKESDVELFDFRPALLAAKQRDQIYYATDTHWNELGQYAAYQALVAHLSKSMPIPPPVPFSEFQVERAPRKGGDLAFMLSLGEEYEDEEIRVTLPGQVVERSRAPYYLSPWLVTRTTPFALDQDAPELPRLLVFHDSFGAGGFAVRLSKHFSHSLFAWSQSLIGELVEAEKPDIVVIQTVERWLAHPPPVDSDAVTGLSRDFARADPVLRIDEDDARERLELSGHISWESESGPPVLVLNHESAHVVLPPLEVAPDQRVLVRLRFDSAQASECFLYWGQHGYFGFSEDTSQRRSVIAGSFDLYFEVPTENWDGRLAFMPGRHLGTYPFHSVEVRRLPKAPDAG